MNKTILGVGLMVLAQLGDPSNSLADEYLTTDCKVKDVVYLDQGPHWTNKNRCLFYHLSQEARLIPYDWFLHLKAPVTGERFAEHKNLAQYGLLSDGRNDVFNGDCLPVGLAKANSVRPPQIGFTCAFCHTSELVHKGTRFRIDGGPSLQQNFRFLKDLAAALGSTLSDQGRFDDFAKEVLKNPLADPTQNSLDQLKGQLQTRMMEQIVHLSRLARIESYDWGPGRFDALGRGGNMIYHESQWDVGEEPRCNPPNAFGEAYMKIAGCDNLRAINGPVSIPNLWGAWEQDWLLWNGAMQNPTARAMVEGLSIDTRLKFDHLKDPFPVDVKQLVGLDDLGRKIGAPQWPKDHFGPVDLKLAERGKQLFDGIPAKGKNKGRKGLCAGCHVPTQLKTRSLHDQQWEVVMSPVEKIGTDPLAAFNFHRRRVQLGPDRWPSISDATEWVTGQVMQQNSQTMVFAGKTVAQISSNPWRSCVKVDNSDCLPSYKARPLDGIWATAPFLHNGSVPTVYELLSPRTERSSCFFVGPGIEFDTQKLGLAVTECSGRSIVDPTSDFEFDTSKPGNWNMGHEFKDATDCKTFPEKGGVNGVLGCEIKKEDRQAIIEYLKILKTPLPPLAKKSNQAAQFFMP